MSSWSAPHLTIGRSSLVGLASLLWSIGLVTAQVPPGPAHLIVHLLDYVAVDYPEFVHDGMVLDQAEYDEQLEFAQQVRTMFAQLPAYPDRANLLRLADELINGIQGKRQDWKYGTRPQLRWSIIRAYDVEVAPKRPPDLRLAATLYRVQCAACHGPEGRGDGPAAASLDPTTRTSTIAIAWINVAFTAFIVRLAWGSRAQGCQRFKGSAKTSAGDLLSMSVTSPALKLSCCMVPSCGSLTLDGAGSQTLPAL